MGRTAEERSMAEGWEVVATVDDAVEAELLAGFLENAGVPSAVESSQASEFPFTVGGLAVVRVEVPADRLEEARRLIAEREAAVAADEAGEDQELDQQELDQEGLDEEEA
jgi:hypothetical protein